MYVKNGRKIDACQKTYVNAMSSTKEPNFVLSLKELSTCGLELKRVVSLFTRLFNLFILINAICLGKQQFRTFLCACIQFSS